MDWIKIKVKHILFTDLEPDQIGTLVTIQALTAAMERIPTRKEITKHVHYKRLESIEKALKRVSIEAQELVKDGSTELQELVKDGSRELQSILNKVLKDVQEVHQKRLKGALKKRELRSKSQNVPRDIPDTSTECPIREDKIREDKSIDTPIGVSKKEVDTRTVFDGKINSTRPVREDPPELSQVMEYMNLNAMQNSYQISAKKTAHKFIDHYTGNGWMTGQTPMFDWPAIARKWLRNEEEAMKSEKKKNNGVILESECNKAKDRVCRQQKILEEMK